jgi:hypothetical protein
MCCAGIVGSLFITRATNRLQALDNWVFEMLRINAGQI